MMICQCSSFRFSFKSLVDLALHARKKEASSNKRCRGESRIFFRRGCTRLLLYFNTNKPHSFFCRIPVALENRRSSQGGGGGGVRTPCTLPQDPPLHCYISGMTHAKIIVILAFQSGYENQRATRAMRAMSRVLRNCKCMKNVCCLVPKFC